MGSFTPDPNPVMAFYSPERGFHDYLVP